MLSRFRVCGVRCKEFDSCSVLREQGPDASSQYRANQNVRIDNQHSGFALLRAPPPLEIIDEFLFAGSGRGDQGIQLFASGA